MSLIVVNNYKKGSQWAFQLFRFHVSVAATVWGTEACSLESEEVGGTAIASQRKWVHPDKVRGEGSYVQTSTDVKVQLHIPYRHQSSE